VSNSFHHVERVGYSHKYSIGIDEIDTQHRQILHAINQISRAIELHRTEQVLTEQVPELTAFLESHFAAEEKYMLEYDYPGYDEHRKEHVGFFKEYNAHLKSLIDSSEMNTLLNKADCTKVLDFIVNWIANHIDEIDMKMASFLVSEGSD
jgi:hemerythrin